MELIKLFFLLVIIIFTNFIFKSKNFLLSYTGLKHQIYIQQNKIPLSGGFILLIYFLFPSQIITDAWIQGKSSAILT